MKTYTAAVRDYPYTTPVKSGERAPRDCKVDFLEIEPIHRAFAPMVRELKYDFSELALATYLQAHAEGKELSLLPLTLHGNFHHRSIVRLVGGPVESPKDLAGKRVGVRSYTQTTGMWVRGVLAEDYGVDPDDITWVTTEGPHVAEYVEPANVERTSDSLVDLARSGDITAVVMGPKAVPADAPLEPLIEDYKTVEQAWYQRHQTVPINHLLTVRTEILREDPEAVRSVLDTFAAEIDAWTAKSEPGPRGYGHGLTDSIREALRLSIDYAAQQHLITDKPTVDDLFADYNRYLGDR
ncbi:ABC transporter substrate-binding protein [Nocardia sp. CA2R105]|uniref:ABC transporter substrate-binding protein n=1 Tax=Nocardia coffeae TaxID=2873381 RepID=UPI001CA60A80|nr:ABC transporter substrate-binding protein [Nocardia coffeae]MBY8855048.1 ABC transporter substrate-binding protein [Nocardia coffeae]